jgi:hypothetical protein
MEKTKNKYRNGGDQTQVEKRRKPKTSRKMADVEDKNTKGDQRQVDKFKVHYAYICHYDTSGSRGIAPLILNFGSR